MKTKLLMLMLVLITSTATYAVAEKPNEKEVLEIVKSDPITDIQIYSGKIYFFETTDSYKIFADNSIEKVQGIPIIRAIIIFDDYEHNNGITDLSNDELMSLLENKTYSKKAKDGYMNDIDSITWTTERTLLFFSLFHKHDVSFNLQNTVEDGDETYTAYAKVTPYNLWFPNPFAVGFLFWFIAIMLHMSDYRRNKVGAERNGEGTRDMKWSKIFMALGLLIIMIYMAVIIEFWPGFVLNLMIYFLGYIRLKKENTINKYKNGEIFFFLELFIMFAFIFLLTHFTIGYTPIEVWGFIPILFGLLLFMNRRFSKEPWFEIVKSK